MDAAANAPDPGPSPPGSGAFPHELSDLCVKCGLCAPHCPTYRLSGEEGESPRGRISLIQGLARGQLEATDQLANHLDNCLTCRACERVCPARVPFGSVIDAGRVELRRARSSKSAAPGWFSRIAAHARLTALLFALLRVARALGFHRAIRRLGLANRHWLFRSVDGLSPAPAFQLGRTFPAVGPETGKVSLFTGCVARVLDGDALRACVSVVTKLGYAVVVPGQQGCCGALPLHDGDLERAAAMRSRNLSAFANSPEPILHAATGCAITLRESDTGLARKLTSVSGFVLDRIDRLAPQIRPRNLVVAVHTPCSARLLPRDPTVTLLQSIPGVKTKSLCGLGCCGAAGHHFLTRPTQADALVAHLLEEIKAMRPDIVVTSNPGCALHLSGALKARGDSPRVVHPLQIVAMSLRSD